MNDIVVVGRDGSTWRYHAIHGPEYTPQETGWVLVVENSPKDIAPQAVTAAEVFGDLRSMEATDPPPEAMVRFFTEQMIDTLEQRGAELDQQGQPSDEERERLASLNEELADLIAAGKSAED